MDTYFCEGQTTQAPLLVCDLKALLQGVNELQTTFVNAVSELSVGLPFKAEGPRYALLR